MQRRRSSPFASILSIFQFIVHRQGCEQYFISPFVRPGVEAPAVFQRLLDFCLMNVQHGTPKVAKHCVRAILANSNDDSVINDQLLKTIEVSPPTHSRKYLPFSGIISLIFFASRSSRRIWTLRTSSAARRCPPSGT